ncbi:Hemin-binding periplasmic protein HmuT precursor [Aquimixticola soesokkakensis]|uniref:Hemin-binding periplasmic protein HmuT n=1 Tax=Aquimixticola soesokkakensis TaxID=1519096 RepID=A0A1Y5TBQ6_9RHOB|nr:ABC transporter substrate-binding protein [Aquimixticola soesokkakensis]SLN60353.1 Hemin-binding periplasmic protein HmuT precursor [Aquimixticola soesokkakensis]
MKQLILAALLAAPLGLGGAQAQNTAAAQRIVSIGGPVSEIIYALGEGARVVARDTTSTFPQDVTALPDVGYMRQLSAEGVLSVNPDLILTRDTAGPPEVLDQLRAASVPVVAVHDGFSAEAVVEAIHTVGAALGVPEKSDALAAEVTQQFKALADRNAAQALEDAPRAMFILSNQAGRLNVAGGGTGADGILALAGAQNVMGAAYQGYKIMSDEAIITAAPDVIVMMEDTDPAADSAHDARRAEVLALPAIALTPAGRNAAFVLVAPSALGFGPRTAQFATGLHAALADAVGRSVN